MKKIVFLIIKSILVITFLLTVILFFYTVFLYEPNNIEENIVELKIEEENKVKKEKTDELKIEEPAIEEKKVELKKNKNQTKKIKTTIKDGLFATVGNKAITKSDILNEIKRILILNNMTFSMDKKDSLERNAINSVIKRNIKQIAISKNNFLKFNQSDLSRELNKLANNMNVDLNTLKNICEANEISFSVIEDPIKVELLWNSLIFAIYKDRVSVNLQEIDEQLKLNQNKKEFNKYLLSEILIKIVDENKIESQINEIKKRIEIEGFEKIAMDLSISQTAEKGGQLGWLHENQISKRFKSIIFNTPINSISVPILIDEGILFFKINDKKTIKQETDLEQLKNQLVNDEKTKILNMYSKSHYDSLKRSIAINLFNE